MKDQILEKLYELEALEEIHTAAMKRWDDEPENIEAEEAENIAYFNQYSAMQEAVEMLVQLSRGAVEGKAAREMISARREGLKEILAA